MSCLYQSWCRIRERNYSSTDSRIQEVKSCVHQGRQSEMSALKSCFRIQREENRISRLIYIQLASMRKMLNASCAALSLCASSHGFSRSFISMSEADSKMSVDVRPRLTLIVRLYVYWIQMILRYIILDKWTSDWRYCRLRKVRPLCTYWESFFLKKNHEEDKIASTSTLVIIY